MTNREIAERYTGHPENVSALEKELDAAEHRGRIAELEDLLESDELVSLDMATATALRLRLAQLRAEEKTR